MYRPLKGASERSSCWDRMKGALGGIPDIRDVFVFHPKGPKGRG